MKRSYQIALSLAGFFLLNFLCKAATDDFSPSCLIPPAPKTSPWKLSKEPQDLESLLSQPYTYLGKGKQSYVFESKDKKHVLKLFKPSSPQLSVVLGNKQWNLSLGKVPFMKELLKDIHSPSFVHSQEKEFQSYSNALLRLRDKTLLEYVHLTHTDHLKGPLILYDKIGVLHKIDPNKTSFLLQEKTDMLYPSLKRLIVSKNTHQAKELLSRFVDFYFDLIDEQIVQPTTLEKNLGCVGLQPIQIDVGRLLTAQDLNKGPVLQDQIYHSTFHMKKWLTKNAPDLVPYLEALIQQKKER